MWQATNNNNGQRQPHSIWHFPKLCCHALNVLRQWYELTEPGDIRWRCQHLQGIAIQASFTNWTARSRKLDARANNVLEDSMGVPVTGNTLANRCFTARATHMRALGTRRNNICFGHCRPKNSTSSAKHQESSKAMGLHAACPVVDGQDCNFICSALWSTLSTPATRKTTTTTTAAATTTPPPTTTTKITTNNYN